MSMKAIKREVIEKRIVNYVNKSTIRRLAPLSERINPSEVAEYFCYHPDYSYQEIHQISKELIARLKLEELLDGK